VLCVRQGCECGVCDQCVSLCDQRSGISTVRRVRPNATSRSPGFHSAARAIIAAVTQERSEPERTQ